MRAWENKSSGEKAMTASRRIIGFINVGHMIDHMFMLIFPTAVLSMQSTFARPYSELIALALGGFIAFGAGSYPAGWLGDRWSRRNMMAVFFLGIGAATFATGFVQTTWQLAIGLAVIGLFAAIYHPVGTAMLVSHADRVGRAIGVNGVWGNLGVAFAALVTGGISQWLGWRYAFILLGAAAVVAGGLYLALVPAEANQMKARTGTRVSFPRTVVVRAFLVLALVTLAGGVVFNATTVALPKLIDERLPQLGGSTFGVGLLVCAVYVVGATSQLAMGWIIDRQPLKVGFLAIAVFQAPFLAAAAFAKGWLLVVVVVAMIFTIFGQVTFNDGMVARYANTDWRARVYAVRYLLSFGVSAVAIPLVAFMHAHGGFTALLEVLSLCSLLVLIGALLFPYRRDEIEPFEIRRAAPVSAE
jgi:MFS family permease